MAAMGGAGASDAAYNLGAPHMTYFPLAGRGELIRLIAAAGGLELTESTEMAAGETKDMYCTPSGLPVLRHGDLRMSQSGAIENYVAALAPKFRGLTLQQRAVDQMYAGIKEELLANCAKAIFTTRKSDPAKATEDVTALLDKWLAIFEAKVPTEGFVLGLPFPTVADLSLLNITTGYMPFGAATKHAGYSFDKFPKVLALCDRTAKADGVKGYIAASATASANPFNM
jgi:glutathione S-transferase